MTYTVGGRQYLVIAAGGHDRLHTPQGDYVLAFTLPGPGAPAPDTTTGPRPGDYAGELRIGHARIGARLTVRAAADSLAGTLTLDSLRVTGPLSVRSVEHGLVFDFPFDYAAKQCAGTIGATGEYANGGALVVGSLRVVGTCTDAGAAVGTFSLWRGSR